AAAVAERQAVPLAPSAIAAAAPLTPPQLWLLSQDLAAPGHWNQALMLRVAAGLDPQQLERALARLVEHHPMLHARFRRDRMEPGEAPRLLLNRIGLTGLDHPERLTAQVCGALQAGLEPQGGRLLAAALFVTGQAEDRLFLAIHHLAV